MTESSLELIVRRYTIITVFEIDALDIAAKSIFEMYARNICQQLEWGNGVYATTIAEEGAKRLLKLGSKSGVMGAAALFAICIRQQLDWGNGVYATDVASLAAETILSRNLVDGVPVVQKLFDICIKQQLAWGNGVYAKQITDQYADIVLKYSVKR